MRGGRTSHIRFSLGLVSVRSCMKRSLLDALSRRAASMGKAMFACFASSMPSITASSSDSRLEVQVQAHVKASDKLTGREHAGTTHLPRLRA